VSDLLSLSDQAYYVIRRDILTCRLLPGSLVTESELMERYQAGKSTIRLALTRLNHEQVRYIPWSGKGCRYKNNAGVEDLCH